LKIDKTTTLRADITSYLTTERGEALLSSLFEAYDRAGTKAVRNLIKNLLDEEKSLRGNAADSEDTSLG
jgi:hypothetical protein